MSTRHPSRVLPIVALIAMLLITLHVTGGNAAAAGGITINDVTVTEGNSGTVNATFTISLDVAVPTPTTVSYTTADNTAVASSGDYVAKSGIATISANATSTTVTVLVNGDTLNEANETFFVNLSNPSAGAAILDAQGIGTINNNDAVPKIIISDFSATEGLAGTNGATFSVSLSAASGQAVSMTYATSNGTATAGTDYVAIPATVLSFAPGETAKTITVPVNDDALDELDETFNVNLTSAVNASIQDNKGVGTILNDDLPPAISINDVQVIEGNTGTVSAIFTVSLSAPSGKSVTVKYQTANSTATAPADYTALPLTTLTFPPGTPTLNVNVVVKGDTLAEGNETFTVNLSVPANATIAKSQGLGTIIDDDQPPTISIGDITVAEPASGTATATFIVTLSAPSGQSVSMSYATADGTATAPLDYIAVPPTVLSFLPGEASKQISVSINSDQLIEPDETFFVDLSSPSNAAITKSRGQGLISSTAGVPSASILDKQVTEGIDGSAGFLVQLSAPSQQPVTVTYVVAGVTAVSGADFQAPGLPLSITFPAGSLTQTIAVPILDDTLDESDETFDVTLTGATGATIADGVATGTIIDNDPQPTITILDFKASDSGSTPNAIFTVSLSVPSSNTISVSYQTADGTAIAGSDYQAQSGTLTIPAGATSATIAVPIIADTLAEPDETFTVNLGNAFNATLARSQGIGTISDRPQTAPQTRVYAPMILH